MGERILIELGAERTNDTLTRWLAHHIADLIQAADDARAAGAPNADERAAEARTAILQLWAHRSAWPNGWPPPRAAEMVSVLDALPEPGDTSLRRTSLLAELHDLHHHLIATIVDVITPRGGGAVEQGWLDTFGEHLTPAEVAVLGRVADTDARLSKFLRWWENDIDPAEHDQIGENVEGDSPTSELTPHPLVDLADAYRNAVRDLVAATERDDDESPSEPQSPGLA